MLKQTLHYMSSHLTCMLRIKHPNMLHVKLRNLLHVPNPDFVPVLCSSSQQLKVPGDILCVSPDASAGTGHRHVQVGH